MAEEAHKLIINRQKARNWSRKNLKPQIDLLNDLVDYGSNLIIRLLDNPSNQLEDAIIKGVFLKQIVSMLDSVSILIENGATHAAFLSARSAFEASLYLDWCLFSDAEKKAKYYYVHNLRQNKDVLQKTISTNPDYQEFNRAMNEMGWDLATSEIDFDTDAANEILEIDRILSKPRFKNIDQEYDRKKGKRKYDKQWYEVLGQKSIRSLAETLGRVGEYDIFYKKGAKIHHASSYIEHVRFADKSASLIPIRHFQEASEILRWMISIVLMSYKKILMLYRMGEVDGFVKKYMAEWQSSFQSIPNITIDWQEYK